ncbi:MAG: hypothetical protein ACREMR_12145 [Gemmatimonadales bacterium]
MNDPPGESTVWPATPPVATWTAGRELLAWRIWRLGWHARAGGLRLVSFTMPHIWDGPVLHADVPPGRGPGSTSGVHAFRSPPPGNVRRACGGPFWISGWVALSGLVVEHELGYRAEVAVVRRLRLGVPAHLAAQEAPAIRRLRSELEWRYQAPVKLGIVERRIAGRVARPGAFYDVPVIDPIRGWVHW